MTTPVEMNQVYTISVTDLGVHGEGIGRVGGFTVFVPGALPGETVSARIAVVKKSYAVGRLMDIAAPSPDRVVPACSVYGQCGGCQISHLSYDGQCRAAERLVRNVVERIGGYDVDIVRPVLAAADPFHYRNKMAVPVGKGKDGAVLGYYRQGSHAIVPVERCAIQREENNRLLAFARDFIRRHGLVPYDEKTGKGTIRHVMGRVGAEGKVMAVIVTASRKLPCGKEWVSEMRRALPEVVSIYHNVQSRRSNVILGRELHLLWGEKTLAAELCGLHFDVSPFSFFQVNQRQAEVLYGEALSMAALTGKETVIDAYCGTGTISLCLAKNARKVIGIEIVEPAVENARENAKRNGISHAEFIAGDAADIMPRLYREGLAPDVIVCDPARAGCDEKVLAAAAGMAPARIVYVSCNPSTFARDAARLRPLGYVLRQVQPVDMFPQTMHVELVGLFTKEDSDAFSGE